MTDNSGSKIQTNKHIVLEINHLNNSTFIIRMERNQLRFKAGQHIGVGPIDSIYTREYSVYSGENDNYLEILVKEVEDGFISPLLKKVNVGDYLQVEEARGYYGLPFNRNATDSFLFIATGTGIAPFHSFIKSNPELNYKLIHGIRNLNDACEPSFYEKDKLVICTSREQTESTFYGRVTKFLENYSIQDVTRIYLCGNVSMINDVYDYLGKKGYPLSKVQTEVYF